MANSKIITGQEAAPLMTANQVKCLSEWIFERIKPFIVGRVLEVSCHGGKITDLCKEQCHKVNVEVICINFEDNKFDIIYSSLFDTFDTIIMLHNAEQISSNFRVVANCKKLLKKGGHLLIRLLAPTALYKGLVEGLKYWKDHNQLFINNLLYSDFVIVKTRYFVIEKFENASLKLLSIRNEYITPFDETISIGFNTTGLSVIVAGRKK